MTSGRKGDAHCGTYSGYTSHYKRGEKPCEACREAKANAQRESRLVGGRTRGELWAEKLAAKAEIRAQRRANYESCRRGETCRQGHPWTEESTGEQSGKNGTTARLCLICRREWTETHLYPSPRHREVQALRDKSRPRDRPGKAAQEALHRLSLTEDERERRRERDRAWRAANREHVRVYARLRYVSADPLMRRAYKREHNELRRQLEAS